MERTGATGAAIALTTEDALCCRASAGAIAPDAGAPLRTGSLTGRCLRTGEVLLCNDTSTDRRADPQLCKEIGVRSALVLPIRQNAKVVGVLEVLSINPNAFNEHYAAAMSKLADQVLPLLPESMAIPQHNNRLSTTDAAEVLEWNGHCIGSQLADQAVTVASEDHTSGARGLPIGFVSVVALSLIFGYGYHAYHSRLSTPVAIHPLATASHKLATPNQQSVLSEQNEKTSGEPKDSASVLTATRQEAILAIQEPVQGIAVSRTLSRADADDSIAQYELALRYANGEGVPQNYRDAMAWFAKAAANGNDNAQWKLGLGYLKGIGVPHDERQAVVWFKTAANQGHIRAQRALSDLYFDGRGVSRDYVRAYTWASIAAGSRANENDRLKVIGSRMTEAQIEDAHRRISIWWDRQKPRPVIPVNIQNTSISDESDK